MRALIAYYSRTGGNEKLAKQLQERLQSDIDQIVDTTKREGPWGFLKSGLAAMLKRTTKIEFSKDPSDHDLVVIVTPVWVGSLPPATRTYIKEHKDKLKQFAILSLCGSGEDNPRALPDVEATAGKKPFASLLIKEAEVQDESTKQKIEGFIKAIQQ